MHSFPRSCSQAERRLNPHGICRHFFHEGPQVGLYPSGPTWTAEYGQLRTVQNNATLCLSDTPQAPVSSLGRDVHIYTDAPTAELYVNGVSRSCIVRLTYKTGQLLWCPKALGLLTHRRPQALISTLLHCRRLARARCLSDLECSAETALRRIPYPMSEGISLPLDYVGQRCWPLMS